MNFTLPILQSIIANHIDGSVIYKIMDKIYAKGNTVAEQLIYCIHKALIQFSLKYGFEFDMMISKRFLEELLCKDQILSEDALLEILNEIVDLEFGIDELNEWFHLIEITIAEEKLDVLRDYILLQNTKNRQIRAVYPQILTAKPPLPPEEYLDRAESEMILESLNVSKKLVLVNGIGGIGKSTVCRRIFHEISETENRPLAWIVYNDKDLLDDMKKQLFYPKDGKDWEKRFTQFIEQDIDERAIIFIDNVNVTEEEETYLSKLSNAKCSIVCTSRIEKFLHYEIVPIPYFDDEKCIELFYKYYKLEYDEKRIQNIITRAGRHTLVIEILGKIGNAENYSLEELENKLIQEGFDLEGIASVENKEDTLVGHLSRTFNFKKLTDVQKEILYCMAILPVQWIPADLKKWLGLSNSYNIVYLVKHAWFEQREKKYYMHPVVKEVVKRGIQIPKDAVLRLLKGIGDEIVYKDNPDVEKAKLFLSFAESILDVLSDEMDLVISEVTYHIAVLYSQFGDYDQAKKYIRHCIKTEENGHYSESLLAEAYEHQGYIFYYNYEDAKAEQSYLKSYQVWKKLKNQKHIAAIEGNLALLYQGMWAEDKGSDNKKNTYLLKARKFQNKSIQRFEHIFKGKLHSNMASAYNNMAVISYSLKEYETAVSYYRKAETIRIKLADKISPGDMSVTYKGLCDSFYKMACECKNSRQKILRYKLALTYLNNAIKIREEEIKKGNQKWEVRQLQEMYVRIDREILSLMEEDKGQARGIFEKMNRIT